MSGLENPVHWIILLGIALVVLGPKRLPEVGRSLGRGIREFKESVSGSDAGDDGASKTLATTDATEPASLPDEHVAQRADAPSGPSV